ncbi:Rieske (2Fe-2S) protein [Halorubrum rutilum]|uniref:Rieske (2Fe-2S) protein n=1 Tax=Halorubrum rutilum TaxID=1364933 RepID=A0ABD6AFH1_9EURY|nr:Rieske 2Fe-2S domain-containing protein [Halorubrum rutilum]
MPNGTRLTDVETVTERGSYRFTAADRFTNDREVVLVPCEEPPGVRAWVNTCPHESQRFDTGDGVPMRDGEVICPRHGSLFDACSGDCDNGPAAGTTLRAVEVAVGDGAVYLTDDGYSFRHEGGTDDGDPGSTSHLSL